MSDADEGNEGRPARGRFVLAERTAEHLGAIVTIADHILDSLKTHSKTCKDEHDETHEDSAQLRLDMAVIATKYDGLAEAFGVVVEIRRELAVVAAQGERNAKALEARNGLGKTDPTPAPPSSSEDEGSSIHLKKGKLHIQLTAGVLWAAFKRVWWLIPTLAGPFAGWWAAHEQQQEAIKKLLGP